MTSTIQNYQISTGPTAGTVINSLQLTAGHTYEIAVYAGLSGGANSAQSTGLVTNPGAAGTIASIPSATLDAIQNGGLWQISLLLQLSGTVAAGDANNMQFTAQAGSIKEVGCFPGIAGNYPQTPFQYQRTAGTAITLQSIAAASGASAVYGGQMVATPLGLGDADSDNIGLYVDGVLSDTIMVGGSINGLQPLPNQRIIDFTSTGLIQLKALVNATSTQAYRTKLVAQDLGAGIVTV